MPTIIKIVPSGSDYFICIVDPDGINRWLANTGEIFSLGDFSRRQSYYTDRQYFNSSRFAIQVVKRVFPNAQRSKKHHDGYIEYISNDN